MNLIKKIIEFILITLIFFAFYQLSMILHDSLFSSVDPALLVLLSFLISFVLLFFYRFLVSHGTAKRVRKEVHEVYRTKKEKEDSLRQESLKILEEKKEIKKDGFKYEQ